ncbi:MAG: hypothetical protein NZL91_10005 [Thermoflexales bacterium]|nr:hypothetical protein [Thermoflexales bacterium]MCS7324460.1 hypothetical protein [Thermoflexales bacterium]MDW8054351.1 hypothetical protein [Anaerolineae bacterium]MDW8291487.1 hypothetical protein [Anaerolineae bacterium]
METTLSNCFWSGFILGLPTGLLAAGIARLVVKHWRVLLLTLFLLFLGAVLLTLIRAAAEQCPDACTPPATPTAAAASLPVESRR